MSFGPPGASLLVGAESMPSRQRDAQTTTSPSLDPESDDQQSDGQGEDFPSSNSPDEQLLFQLTTPIPDLVGVGHVFLVAQPGRFPKQFMWTSSERDFEPGDIQLRWIANLNGRVIDITAKSNTTNVPDTGLGDRATGISTEVDMSLGLNHVGLDMFMVLEYPKENVVQVSPLFSVANDTVKKGAMEFEIGRRISTSPKLQEGFLVHSEDNLLPNDSLPAPVEVDSTGSSTPSNVAIPQGPTLGSDPSDKVDGGSGSLATGAKIGIAVACTVVGLAIIALIAFLLIRRRKRRSGDHVRTAITYDASPRGAVNEYIADKETQGPRVAESPYTDDGRGSALLATQEHEQERSSFSPYMDTAPHAITTDARVESRQGARSLTPTQAAAQGTSPTDSAVTQGQSERQLPTSVAHLVEDGMTEEQIRRLEEEERALDRAIEQAGHGNR